MLLLSEVCEGGKSMVENAKSKERLAGCIPMHLALEYSSKSATEGKIEIAIYFETEQNKLIFERFVSLFSGSRESIIDRLTETAEPISLSPHRLSNIISRWYPSKNSLKKMEVIRDIISRVKSKDIGTYIYECNHSKYKLTVSEDKCFLHNLLTGKAYWLVS